MTDTLRLEFELMCEVVVDMIGVDDDPASVAPPLPAQLHDVIRATQQLRKATAALQAAENEARRLA